MAHGAPDWTDQVQVVIVEAEAEDEAAETQLDRLSTSSTSYGTVVSWTVTTDKIGVLHCIEMESDNYDKTRFQLTIAGVVQFTDIQIGASLSLEYPDVKIAAGSEVLLEAKSSDGTAINVDGDILGKEVG
uniref:Uncharacterized protein n=1 Tax=viral metagenome TaxID=1070528 RepID=A0A6M3XSF4_9ZZZZ